MYDIFYTNGTRIDSIINASSTTSFSTSEAGIYTLLKVVDSKGCESIDMTGFATVIINPLPEPSIVAYPIQTEITDPIIFFTDESSNHISGVWNFDDGQTQISNFKTVNHLYSDTGTYQVSLTVTSIDGCIDTACTKQ